MAGTKYIEDALTNLTTKHNLQMTFILHKFTLFWYNIS